MSWPTLTIEEIGEIARYVRAHPEIRREDYPDPYVLLAVIRGIKEQTDDSETVQSVPDGEVPDLSGQDEQ